jgi:hypothetical protein
MSRHEIPERHQRVIRALNAGGPATPESLYARVAVSQRPAVSRPRRFAPAMAAVAASIALAAVVAVVSISSGGGPAVESLARISERPATQSAPPSDGTLLDREFAGVAFPDWSGEFGWKAIGGRSDTFDGRRAETVFYSHHGHRIAYTVVDGEPLEPPEGATTVRVDGVTLHQFRDGPRDIVTFERNGRTCVLGGEVIHAETLVELAGWQGRGAIEF